MNKLYKENIFLEGLSKNFGIDNIRLDENYNIEFGKCECSHFHSLFAYGIVGLILVLILFFLIIYYPVISDIKKRLQKFIFKIGGLSILIFYGLLFPDLPAWFGYALYVIEKENIYNMNFYSSMINFLIIKVYCLLHFCFFYN